MRLIITITTTIDLGESTVPARAELEKLVRSRIKESTYLSFQTQVVPSFDGEPPPKQYENYTVIRCIQMRSTALGMHRLGRGFALPIGTTMECGEENCETDHSKNLPPGTLLWGPRGFQPAIKEEQGFENGWLFKNAGQQNPPKT